MVFYHTTLNMEILVLKNHQNRVSDGIEDIFSPLLKAVPFTSGWKKYKIFLSLSLWWVGTLPSSGLCTGGHRDYHDDQSQHVSYEDTGDHRVNDDHFSSSISTAILTEE